MAEVKLAEKEYVILKGLGVEKHEGLAENCQKYEISHAERILAMQKLRIPKVWELADPNYKLVDGKLIKGKN